MMMGLFPRGAQILETPNLDTLASTIPLRKGGTKLINLPLSMLMVDLAGLLPTPRQLAATVPSKTPPT